MRSKPNPQPNPGPTKSDPTSSDPAEPTTSPILRLQTAHSQRPGRDRRVESTHLRWPLPSNQRPDPARTTEAEIPRRTLISPEAASPPQVHQALLPLDQLARSHAPPLPDFQSLLERRRHIHPRIPRLHRQTRSVRPSSATRIPSSVAAARRSSTTTCSPQRTNLHKPAPPPRLLATPASPAPTRRPEAQNKTCHPGL